MPTEHARCKQTHLFLGSPRTAREMGSDASCAGSGVCSITFSNRKSQWWNPKLRCALSNAVSTCSHRTDESRERYSTFGVPTIALCSTFVIRIVVQGHAIEGQPMNSIIYAHLQPRDGFKRIFQLGFDKDISSG